jgi:hypothetical protein
MTQAEGTIISRIHNKRTVTVTKSRLAVNMVVGSYFLPDSELVYVIINPAIPDKIYARAMTFSSKRDRNSACAETSNNPQKMPVNKAMTGSRNTSVFFPAPAMLNLGKLALMLFTGF